MANKHVTDFEIQEYLDGNTEALHPEFVQHLDTCAECRQRAASYQQLYSGLKSEQELTLPANFAERVLSQIQPAPHQEKTFNWQLFLLIFTGLVAGLGISIHFIGLQKIRNGFSAVLNPFTGIFETIFSSFRNVIAISNTTATLLILSGLVIGVVYLIDHFILSTQLRSHTRH